MTALAALVGVELGPTGWLEVPQTRIDAFAEVTGDPQWIHTDPVRAAAGPFGSTIAHGWLTLSLVAPLLDEVTEGCPDWPSTGHTINYGADRVRFPAPLPSGSRIRARFRVAAVEPGPGGSERARIEATVEREGGEKPVCVADLVLLFFP